MALNFLYDGPATGTPTILLAHGAGGAMDSPALTSLARALASTGLRIARFEFDYMAARRTGLRTPPPRAETLQGEYIAAVAHLAAQGTLIIGGKSMGGRDASKVADALFASHQISGLLCLGYPFHPPGKPDQLRTRHLAALNVPTLIVQGTRDPFGTREEVASYGLSSAIDLFWLEDGDHDLKPRKRISGFSAQDHLRALVTKVESWADRIG